MNKQHKEAFGWALVCILGGIAVVIAFVARCISKLLGFGFYPEWSKHGN